MPRVPASFLRSSLPAAFVGVLMTQPLGGQPTASSPFTQQLAPIGAAAGTAAASADSLAAAGDTTRAIQLLERAVKTNPRDGVAWHYLGMYLWNRVGLGRRGAPAGDQKTVRMLSAADSSLRLATQYAPDSARYWLALSRFNLRSSHATTRASTRGQSQSALEAAKRSNDAASLAFAAALRGTTDWQRYEAVSHRALVRDGQKVQLSPNQNWQRQHARDYIRTFAMKIEPPTGDADYNAALENFRTAVGADSTNQRYSRLLYMALAAKGKWEELAEIAGRRATQFPLDAQARLARGLAFHRLQKFTEARAAFDSAFVLMDEEDVERITRFSRILRPKAMSDKVNSTDSVQFAKLPPAQRRGLELMYWYMNDPLALTAENEYRLEFYARVVYADFRWSDEEQGFRGADTERGDVYVRYGPPDEEIRIGGNTNVTGVPVDNGVTLVWAYDTGLLFFFDLSPAFNTARLAQNDRDFVEKVRDAMPVSFANMPTARMIDTIPVRITRFRVGRDSVDAVVAAAMPMDSLVQGLDLDRVPLDIDFRIFDQFVRVQGVESSQVGLVRDSVNGPESRSWTRRLGPGINVVRVEALQADSRRAARAAIRLDPTPGTGFGMSDVLLGTKPSLREGVTAPRRWSDIAITPSDGSFARNASVGLVWEVYEPGNRTGQSAYRVAISVERMERGGPLGFGVKLFDNVGRAIGRTQQGRDKFTISFDRTAGVAPTLVEYLSLDMGGAPAGGYKLRVEITDTVSGKKTVRDTEFRIR